MGLFNKMDSRREVKITILSLQICSSLSREASYIGHILRGKHLLGTQLPKCQRPKGITNQFPFEYIVVKCQYKLLSLSFVS